MFHLTLDLELYDPIKDLNNKMKEKFILEQEAILKKIFSLLNKNKVRISCFVTNEFVDDFYDFFHKYVIKNHEVGCHTANHFFYRPGKHAELIDSIKKNKAFLERETGLICQGFRAAGGVIPINLIKILKELNFKYDSSLIPGFVPGRLNYSKGIKKPYFPDFDNIFVSSSENNEIIEFPLLVSKIINLSMNGVFFSYFNKIVDLKKYDNKYGVVYLHPYDFKYFHLTDKSYMWDKMKNTKFNWDFLFDYICIGKNLDKRLCKLYEKISEESITP
jgi:peptidoglycan/xylan/chitin deacetylase (PgdA/CDA1 family)